MVHTVWRDTLGFDTLRFGTLGEAQAVVRHYIQSQTIIFGQFGVHDIVVGGTALDLEEEGAPHPSEVTYRIIIRGFEEENLTPSQLRILESAARDFKRGGVTRYG